MHRARAVSEKRQLWGRWAPSCPYPPLIGRAGSGLDGANREGQVSSKLAVLLWWAAKDSPSRAQRWRQPDAVSEHGGPVPRPPLARVAAASVAPHQRPTFPLSYCGLPSRPAALRRPSSLLLAIPACRGDLVVRGRVCELECGTGAGRGSRARRGCALCGRARV